MVASILAAAALTVTPPAAHPCRAPLPTASRVPAPIVLWTSCGSFRLAPSGRVARLPRHWLAKHGSGTGRRYGAHLDIRRTGPGRFLLLSHGRVVWRSTNLYPRDGDGIAFGPHSFAFASYRHGIYLTDLQHAERLVLPGRGLYPYSFTSTGQLIVTGPRTIMLISPTGTVLRRFAYRSRNGYGFDEQADSFYYVTPTGRLAVLRGIHTLLERSLAHVEGILTVTRPNLLVFSGADSITATTRSGAVVASAHWSNRRLNSDAGVSVAPDGRTFAFRLSNARPGSHSSSANVYLLHAGSNRAQPIYRHRLGPSGCAVGANLSWHGTNLLYRSSDGTTAVIDTRTGTVTNLTRLAATLPRRSIGERALAAWRSDFPRATLTGAASPPTVQKVARFKELILARGDLPPRGTPPPSRGRSGSLRPRPPSRRGLERARTRDPPAAARSSPSARRAELRHRCPRARGIALREPLS